MAPTPGLKIDDDQLAGQAGIWEDISNGLQKVQNGEPSVYVAGTGVGAFEDAYEEFRDKFFARVKAGIPVTTKLRDTISSVVQTYREQEAQNANSLHIDPPLPR